MIMATGNQAEKESMLSNLDGGLFRLPASMVYAKSKK